jgi:hypothetical protein
MASEVVFSQMLDELCDRVLTSDAEGSSETILSVPMSVYSLVRTTRDEVYPTQGNPVMLLGRELVPETASGRRAT